MKKLCLILSCFVAVHAHAQRISIANDSAAIRTMLQPQKVTIIQPDFYSTHLGFFCTQEIKIEKQWHVPLIFRLGSVEYNNWLEQKAGCYYKP